MIQPTLWTGPSVQLVRRDTIQVLRGKPQEIHCVTWQFMRQSHFSGSSQGGCRVPWSWLYPVCSDISWCVINFWDSGTSAGSQDGLCNQSKFYCNSSELSWALKCWTRNSTGLTSSILWLQGRSEACYPIESDSPPDTSKPCQTRVRWNTLLLPWTSRALIET